MVENGIYLQPRLSTAAARKLLEVHRLVAGISLGPGTDRRFIDSPRKGNFCSREAYIMMSPPHPPDASACVAWSLRLPSKLKIFAYLADIDRLRRFSIWELPAPLGVATATWYFGVVAIMWSIWKTRNDLVFNGNTATPSFPIRRACDDIALWRWRIPRLGRADVDELRSYMIMRCD
ncbi:hypothetical protein QYE76_015119 [Lolium multiflorum]|uniref:Uncharacterized protein n=1 Tax=Lolium multiflorum TaxID=4521 RepID=A0AAD8U4A1_LOLMU|nr:hypothetical protein QYE76_015119 [Lolium multiflorum]